jgi:hypothetical protein
VSVIGRCGEFLILPGSINRSPPRFNFFIILVIALSVTVQTKQTRGLESVRSVSQVVTLFPTGIADCFK